MTVKERIAQLVAGMPEDEQRLVLELARFLKERNEQEDWRRAAREQFGRVYGSDEPEYTEADVKAELNA